VLIGDVETLDLAALEGQFDALIVSEVLEHLVDPWGVLKRLANWLKPGAACAGIGAPSRARGRRPR
jgi:2-polyprenyl-3-methyl-5-hydroxy-6-metoxy-1,4-benzoquinol methylase